MRLKLTITSPTSLDPVRLVYPVPPTFLSSSPTILDLIYTIHEMFPNFFHDPREIENYNYAHRKGPGESNRDYGEELFRPVEYACETADGWNFCLWHLIEDTLRDEDHVVIRKLKEENNLLLASPRKPGPDQLTYPGPLTDVLRLMIGTKQSDTVTVGHKRNRDDQDDHAGALPTAATDKRGVKRQKIWPNQDNIAVATPQPDSPINVAAASATIHAAGDSASLPFEGSSSTRSRNSRRRRAKAARKALEKEELEQARSELLDRVAKLDVIPEQTTTTTKPLQLGEDEHTEDADDAAEERNRSASIGIMDKIGSQIQSALSTLSQVVRVATPRSKKRITNEADMDRERQEEKSEIENEQIEVDMTEDKDELVPESASQDMTTTPATTISKRKRPVMVITEAVDCENPTNRSLRIPPFPFQQVNLDHDWKPKYAAIDALGNGDDRNTVNGGETRTSRRRIKRKSGALDSDNWAS
ncbi:hypothetical protein V1509DRAFT_623271 [Lipomyces kononenkoae]